MIPKVKDWRYDNDAVVLNAEDGRYTSEVLVRFSRGDIEEAKTRMEKAEPMMPLLSDKPNKVQDLRKRGFLWIKTKNVLKR
jgi:hypothetical protein